MRVIQYKKLDIEPIGRTLQRTKNSPFRTVNCRLPNAPELSGNY